MGGVKDKIMSLFKTNTTKNYSEPTCDTCQRCVCRSKETENTKKKTRLEDKIMKTIKDWVIRDMKKLFEQEDYYKPVRVDNFYSNNYIKYKSNDDRNKTP